MPHINRIVVRHYRMPLTSPYNLSFTTLNHLDSYVVNLEIDEKNTGFGEVVPLDGYFRENSSSVLKNILTFAETLPGMSELETGKYIQSKLSVSTMACSPFLAGLEMLSGEFNCTNISVPLVGIMSTEEAAPLDKLKALTISGFKTIKIKIGQDVDNDIRQSLPLLQHLNDNQKVRFDANQAYELEAAKLFLKTIVNYKRQVEYVEQPLGIDSWDDTEKLIKESEVNVMLDESIGDVHDIESAARIGASHVKLKLFKHGGIRETGKLALLANKKGLKVILGNGVATDIGNLAEGFAYKAFRSCFEETTEANGFAKCISSLTNQPPKLIKNRMEWQGKKKLVLSDTNMIREWVYEK